MTTLAEGHRLGPYRIVRLIGEGGMGAVYEARQEPLDRRVAVKTLHSDYVSNKDSVARFFNEAKALSRLEHPSIVQVSDFGNAADGTAYLVMEFLRGQSLGRRLRELAGRGERLPLATVMQIGLQTADVVAVAHEQGIVHRDIKPDNLMLIADTVAPSGERVKLLDFGIAKLTRPEDTGSVKTATQAVMGTPSYMSPEQCAGAGGVDAKSDVYSLGCVLFELLAGRPPFVAEGAGQLIGMHLYQKPPALRSLVPQIPASVAELVEHLLIKDKLRRPTMHETAEEIGKLLARLPGGGAVHRTKSSEATDPNARRAALTPPQVTTLGRSMGQHGGHAPRRSIVFAVGLCTILGFVLTVVFHGKSPQPVQVTGLVAVPQPAPHKLAEAPLLPSPPPSTTLIAISQPAPQNTGNSKQIKPIKIQLKNAPAAATKREVVRPPVAPKKSQIPATPIPAPFQERKSIGYEPG